MRTVALLLSLVALPVFAATYYVDAASGNDARTAAQAQSASTPWKTISKAAATATAGDTVVIAGGFYHEQVAPKNAGTAAKPVVYRAKDRSDRPVVDGSILLDTNAWSNVTLVNYRGQSVSVKTCEIGWTPTALFCGGERLRVAHEPEQVNGDDPYELERMSVISSANPGTSTTTLIDTSFFTQSDAKYWVGAELMIYYRGTYGNGNVIEVREITSYSPSAHSVAVSTPFNQGTFSAVCVYPGDRWALRNHIKLLDSPGEYYVDTSVTPNRLYVIPPAGHAATELSATKFDYGFEVSYRAYQTIDSLEFRGQTEAAVFSQYGNAYGKGLVVTNCYIHNELKNGVRVNVTTDAVVSDTVVKLCTNEGISFGSGENFQVLGCTVCSNGNNGVWCGSGNNSKYFAASRILVRDCRIFHQSGRRSHADNFNIQKRDDVYISSCVLEQEGEQNGWCQYTGRLVFTNNTVVGGAFGFGAVMSADISHNFFDHASLRFDAHLDDAPVSEKTHYLPQDVRIANNIVRASAVWWPKKYVTLSASFSTAANLYVPGATTDDWTDMTSWDSTKGVGYGAGSIVETDPAADVSSSAVAARFAAAGLTVGPDFRPEEETPPAVEAQDLTARLEYVGNPTLERWPTRGAANSIVDIEVNDDRLFFACGEWASNPGPVFMESYDPYSGAFTNEYAAGTEGVEVLRTFSDGGLYFPAVDHMDKGSYDNGYWFRRAKGGVWSAGFGKGTAATLYTHVYDMQQLGSWMFLYSGCPVGSKDGGANWVRLDGLSSNKQNGSLLRCGDELFCVEAYPIDFGTGTNPNATPISDQYTRHGPTVWRWNAATEKFTSTTEPTWDNLAPGIVLSDCDLVTTNATQAGRPGRFWHTTPFKDRCLYVIGDEYSDRTYTVNGKSVTLKPVGTRPEIAVSAYALNGALKGERIRLPKKTWPIDFTVVGDAAYMLAFSYVEATQMVRHGVWKSTDGVNFAEILTVDYPQVMQSFDYHMGYFYFGVAHQNAEPNLGPIKAKTPETAGDVYRVYFPQEPVAAVASAPVLSIAEGKSASVSYTLSARPATNVNLSVGLLGGTGLSLSKTKLVFTPSDWNTPHAVTVSYPENDRTDPETLALVCGAETAASLRGCFDSREVTTSLVTVTPVGNDVAPSVTAESFDNAAVPFAYAATLADLGRRNGGAASSATVTLTAYDDAGCTHAAARISKTVTSAGAVSLSLTNLVCGAWYTFVAEEKTSDAVVRRSSKRLRAPLGTAEELVDLTDDLSNRAGYCAANSHIGPADNGGAWDNDYAQYFGSYRTPREAVYIFKTPTVVNGFGLRGQGRVTDNQDRQPAGYSLYGSNDTNGTWTVLAQVTGDPVWDPAGEWRRVPATNETAYVYYKLVLDAPQMPNMSWVMASEAELYRIGSAAPEDPPDDPDDPPEDPRPGVTNGLKIAYWSMSGVSTMNQSAADSRTAVFAEKGLDIVAMRGLKISAQFFTSNGYTLVVTNETNGSGDGGGRQFAWKNDRFAQVGCGGTRNNASSNCTTDWVVLRDRMSSELFVVGSGFMLSAKYLSLAGYLNNVPKVLAAMTNDCPSARVFYCADFAAMTNHSDFVSCADAVDKFAAKGLYPLVAGNDYQWILTTDPTLKGSVSTLVDASIASLKGYAVTIAGGESPAVEVPVISGGGSAALHFDAQGRFVVTVGNAAKGVRYRVYATESLSVPFAPVGEVITAGADGPLSFAVETGSAPSLFVKVVVVGN